MTSEAHARQKRLVEMSLLRVGPRNNEKPQKRGPKGHHRDAESLRGLKTR